MAHYGTLILKKNLYFEAILMKFQKKWGAVAPPAPLFQHPWLALVIGDANTIWWLLRNSEVFQESLKIDEEFQEPIGKS